MQDKHSIGEEPCAGNLASTVLQQRVGQRCPTRLRHDAGQTIVLSGWVALVVVATYIKKSEVIGWLGL